MADESYQPGVYVEQGGERMVVKSGASLDVESGGEIDIESGAALKFAGVALAANADRLPKTVKLALTAGVDTGGGILSWQNNEESADIIVQRLVIDLTTATSGACTADAGQTAVDGTTSSNNLIDGVDLNAATGVFDNIDDQGTSGQSVVRVGDDEWVTITTASGASAGLVGFAYITYVVV